MMYLPAVNTMLTVALPGEQVRVPVYKLVDDHTVLVRIDATPLNPAHTHNYRLGDIVACRRKRTLLGELWEAVEHPRTVAMPPEQQKPKPKTKPKRRKAMRKGGVRAISRRK